LSAISYWLVFSVIVGAQSTGAFMQLEKKVIEKVNRNTNSEPTEIDPLLDKASRFAGNETKLFIKVRSDRFSIKQRAKDPFGLFQDPQAKPAVKRTQSIGSARNSSGLPSIPLAEIVKLIKVTTIMPAEKMFLVGGREFKQSDEFSIVYQGRLKTLKILSVTGNEVVFLDVDGNEKAALKLEVLPPGMSATGDDLRPPGMVDSGEEIPLQLGLPSGQR